MDLWYTGDTFIYAVMSMNLPALYAKYKEPISYLFWGAATTAVNYIIYFLCTDLFQLHYLGANILAWVGAVLFAFVTNKCFVFDSKSWAVAVVLPELLKFSGARVLSGVLETALLWLFVDLCKFPDGIIKIAISVLTVILNYVFSKLFIFRREQNG